MSLTDDDLKEYQRLQRRLYDIEDKLHTEQMKFHFQKSALDETVVNYTVTRVYEADLYTRLYFFRYGLCYLKIGDRFPRHLPSYESVATFCVDIEDVHYYLYMELDENRIIRKIRTDDDDE